VFRTDFQVIPSLFLMITRGAHFIAMVWPAAQNQRGMPDSNKKIGDTSGPLVFETLKQDWEIFQPNGNAPSANWNDFEQNNPCKLQSVGFNDFLLASFSEFGNLGEAGFGNLTHALPAQNKTWVRYATAFNQSEFNEIVSNQFYLRSKLPAADIAFQDGAIDVKSSWIEMTNIPHPERYYTRNAWLKDPVTGLCSTLETWDQNSIGTGCMACHTQTQKNTDFLWTLQVNAFPALAPVNPFVVAQRPTVAVKNLESVLASGEAANKPAKSKKPVAKAPNK